MKPKRLTDRRSRMMAREERDAQWAFMERVAREGVVWMCPWDKHRKHGPRCPGYCARKALNAVRTALSAHPSEAEKRLERVLKTAEDIVNGSKNFRELREALAALKQTHRRKEVMRI